MPTDTLNRTDLAILRRLDADRQTPATLAVALDKQAGYISSRLSKLRNDALVVQPAGPNTGLYTVTDTGHAVAMHAHAYDQRVATLFGELVGKRTSLYDATDLTIPLAEPDPGVFDVLDALADRDHPVFGSDLRDTLDRPATTIEELLFRAHFWSLLDRDDHGRYSINDAGERARGARHRLSEDTPTDDIDPTDVSTVIAFSRETYGLEDREAVADAIGRYVLGERSVAETARDAGITEAVLERILREHSHQRRHETGLETD